MMMRLDPLMVQLIAESEPEHKQVLATAAGEADIVSRWLPADAIPAALQACWLMARASRAKDVDSPHTTALLAAALAMTDRAAQHMEPLVMRAPDSPADM